MTKTRKIGTYVSKPYNASLVYNVRGRLLGTKKDFTENIDKDVLVYGDLNCQLSDAYGFNVRLELVSTCGDQSFYNIIKIYA